MLTNSFRGKLLGSLLICGVSVFAISSPALQAAEAPPETNAPQTSTPQTNTPEPNDPQEPPKKSGTSPSNTGSENRRAGDKGGVFRPSEEISEDVAITFPVDI